MARERAIRDQILSWSEQDRQSHKDEDVVAACARAREHFANDEKFQADLRLYQQSQEQPKEPKVRKQPTKPRTPPFVKRYQEYVETAP